MKTTIKVGKEGDHVIWGQLLMHLEDNKQTPEQYSLVMDTFRETLREFAKMHIQSAYRDDIQILETRDYYANNNIAVRIALYAPDIFKDTALGAIGWPSLEAK